MDTTKIRFYEKKLSWDKWFNFIKLPILERGKFDILIAANTKPIIKIENSSLKNKF